MKTNACSFATVGSIGLLLAAAPAALSQTSALPVNAGTYNGLFSESAAPRHETSGYLSAKLTPQGALSGYVIVAGSRLSFSGRWPTNGSQPAIVVKQKGTNVVTLHLAPSDPDAIEGMVMGSSWTAPLLMERVVWHRTRNPAANFAGRSTMTVYRGESFLQPNGFGYGTLTVDAGGTVKLAGALGDGTKVAQTTTLSASGWWPCYVGAYAGKGAIFGWIPLSNRTNTSARVCWHKGPGVSGQRYPNGFLLTPLMFVSPYVPPAAGQRVINVGQGYITLEGGRLTGPIVNELSLNPANKFTNLGRNQLSVSVNLRTGLLSGALTANGVRLQFGGVISQAVDMGVGHFLGASDSGAMVIAGDRPAGL